MAYRYLPFVFSVALILISIAACGQEVEKEALDSAHVGEEETLPALGAEEEKQKIHQRLWQDAKLIGGGIGYTYARPFHWQKEEWIKFGGIVAGTALVAVTLDRPIRNWIGSTRSDGLDDVEEFLFPLGKPAPTYQGVAAFYAIGLASNNEWMRETASIIAMTLTSAGVLQTVAKTAIGRARPDTHEGPFDFKPFDGTPEYHSFPSGHIMMILTNAYVLGRRVNYLPAKIAFYTLAAGVGWSRIYSDQHWASDVLMGSFITIACAESAIRYVELQKAKKRDPNKASLHILPLPTGLSLTYRF